eukprot:5686910-Prorocentrum_lima.AAC.1
MPPQPSRARQRPLVLVSLFDGAGVARVAIEDVLVHLRRPELLTLSVAAEIDVQLARATTRAMEDGGTRLPNVPHSHI